MSKRSFAWVGLVLILAAATATAETQKAEGKNTTSARSRISSAIHAASGFFSLDLSNPATRGGRILRPTMASGERGDRYNPSDPSCVDKPTPGGCNGNPSCLKVCFNIGNGAP